MSIWSSGRACASSWEEQKFWVDSGGAVRWDQITRMAIQQIQEGNLKLVFLQLSVRHIRCVLCRSVHVECESAVQGGFCPVHQGMSLYKSSQWSELMLIYFRVPYFQKLKIPYIFLWNFSVLTTANLNLWTSSAACRLLHHLRCFGKKKQSLLQGRQEEVQHRVQSYSVPSLLLSFYSEVYVRTVTNDALDM